MYAASAFQIYGNLIPRILDESFTDSASGEQIGRRYAGPEWSVPATFEECESFIKWQAYSIGLDPGERAELDRRLP
ncbi:MAG: hypothetical protein M0D55_03935 [Elusimicrobiota bacterium]|nr:MAG: hypothetical protein M0D55_03935 [Elusimicrobiota bacterium]